MEERVTLSVFNNLGQLVRVLVNDRLAPGQYTVVWDGLDQGGNSLGSGVYTYHLQAEGYNRTRRMVMLR